MSTYSEKISNSGKTSVPTSGVYLSVHGLRDGKQKASAVRCFSMGPKFRMSTGESRGPSRANVHVGLQKVRNSPSPQYFDCMHCNADRHQLILQQYHMDWLSEPHRRDLQPSLPALISTKALVTTQAKIPKDISHLWILLETLQLRRIGSVW